MFKIKQNEVFNNILKTYPKYVFKMFNNKCVLNDSNDEGIHSSDEGKLYLNDLNLKAPVSNNSLYYDKTGSCIVSGGIPDLLSSDGTSINDGNLAISMWVYVETGSIPGNPTLVQIGTQSLSVEDGRDVLYFNGTSSINPFSLVYSIGTPSGEKRYRTEKNILPLEEWTHVAVTKVQFDKAYFYVNGERLTTIKEVDTATAGGVFTKLTASIGNNANDGSVFPGYIDEVSLFSKKLRSSDASYLYNEGQPRDYLNLNSTLSPKIVSHWTMGDGDTAPTVSDKISTNDLIMSGFSTNYGISNKVPLGSQVSISDGNLKQNKKNPDGFTFRREYIHKTDSAGYNSYDETYTSTKTMFKMLTLKNAMDRYLVMSDAFKFENFLLSGGLPTNTNTDTSTGLVTRMIHPSGSINILSIPKMFYENRIKPGSVSLNFYTSGSLIATAQDLYKNGAMVSTLGMDSGSVVGTVLYSEGYILLTGSTVLDASHSEPYMKPLRTEDSAGYDNPKWIHFGSYESATGSNLPSSSYKMEFKGENSINTLMFFAHARKNELNYSNNPSYLEAGNGGKWIISTGSKLYLENESLPIKNTISSSVSHHSESFQQQVFIDRIGVYDKDGDMIMVASLANPLKKRTDLSYTFKLKMDM